MCVMVRSADPLVLDQDADNLQHINAAAISKGIVESCCVLLYLNDETLDSPVRSSHSFVFLFVYLQTLFER